MLKTTKSNYCEVKHPDKRIYWELKTFATSLTNPNY